MKIDCGSFTKEFLRPIAERDLTCDGDVQQELLHIYIYKLITFSDKWSNKAWALSLLEGKRHSSYIGLLRALWLLKLSAKDKRVGFQIRSE